MDIPIAHPEELGLSPRGLSLVEAHILKTMEELEASAGSVLIARKGKIAFERYFGRHSHAPNSTPTNPYSRFMIYSVRKVHVATGLCILMDEGKIDLDSPVIQYLPDFGGDGKERITVRHLCTHTSGLDPKARDWRDAKLIYEVGAIHQYNNLGVKVLTDLMEAVSGTPLHSLLNERLFKPLGMERSGWPLSPDEPIGDRVAVVTSKNDPGRYFHYDPKLVTGYAAHYTTTRELAYLGMLWLNEGEMEGKRIISRDSVKLATTPQAPPKAVDPDGKPANYRGILWWLRVEGENYDPQIGDEVPPGSYAHGGLSHCYLLVCPSLDLVAVKMMNRPGVTESFDYEGDYKRFGDLVVKSIMD